MTTFSTLNREETFHRLATEEYDLLVIGGGITGAGIALDAATRGLKTALVEMRDFASGTSSRSTKLVHGGLRYLKQFEIKEVAELGKERAIVYENGPHVTTPVWMLLPFHKGGTFGKFSTSIGLKVYDFLAGVKASERRSMLTREQTIQKAPLVKKDGLQGGGVYVEYRTDDARLTIEVMKAAAEKGAVIANYAKASGFHYNEKQKIDRVEVIDELSMNKIEIKAKKIVNAAGPWVDDVRDIEGRQGGKHLILSKGVHLVFDQSVFPLQQAVYFDTPDGRMVFAIPREGKAYVGTTDTFYKGDPKDMSTSQEDRDYILKAIHYMFPDIQVTDQDIESSWAGVRPLIHEDGKNPSEISRKDEVWESEKGLITIAGGKLTGYRKMAETVVNKIVGQLQQEGHAPYPKCLTKNLPISGGNIGGSANLEAFVAKKAKKGESVGLTQAESERIVRLYGSNADKVFEFVTADHTTLPKGLYAQLMYGIQHEMVAKPVDFLIRRTGHLFFNIALVMEWKEQLLKEMYTTLKYTEEQQQQFTAELEEEIKRATTAIN